MRMQFVKTCLVSYPLFLCMIILFLQYLCIVFLLQTSLLKKIFENKSFLFYTSTYLRRLYILILINNRYIIEWLSEGDVLVFVVKLLFVVISCAEPLPRQGIYEQ